MSGNAAFAELLPAKSAPGTADDREGAHHIIEGERAVRAGRYRSAIDHFRRALALTPERRGGRRGLALALAGAGAVDEAWPLWRQILVEEREGVEWAQTEIERAMRRGRFELLGRLGRLLAQYRWASRWFPGGADEPPRRVPRDVVSVTKLRHDCGQFGHLRRKGILGTEFDEIIRTYERLATRMADRGGNDARIPLAGAERDQIGHVYNRIVHLAEAPRLPVTLSSHWDPLGVEAQFSEQRTGVVVIDDFLTPEALESVRRFAMELTVWSGIRYAYGRLGAFFHDGFNCPLLLQIAEELKAALPSVITDSYPLRQIWGFKNSADLPPDCNLHADFAAVNVNFWLTPDDCNLDPDTGGMMVYDVDAPRAWDFHTYNGRTDIIKAFLRENQARRTYVPYKQNRCVIFNSDLFHGTHRVHFRPGFENHRINVTMLYGQREDDAHHRSLTGRSDLEARWGANRSAWSSHAFARHRR